MSNNHNYTCAFFITFIPYVKLQVMSFTGVVDVIGLLSGMFGKFYCFSIDFVSLFYTKTCIKVAHRYERNYNSYISEAIAKVYV